MPRAKPSNTDRRELPGKASVRKATARPKGIKSEEKEPRRSPRVNNLLGQSGTRRKR